MIRILLLDDHQLFIDGIAHSFRNDPMIEVIGSANNGKDGMQKIEELNPDLVILDIDFSKTNENGLDILRSIRADYPYIKVLMVTGYYNFKLIETLQQSGANGYLLKNVDLQELRQTIIDIHKNIRVFKYEKLEKPFNYLAPSTMLSERVVEILYNLTLGKPMKQISSELNISEATIKDHLDRARKKLNMNSTNELIYYASKEGYI